jgi:hypothetical protein
VAWTKPSLGLCEFNGSKDNNIILESQLGDGLIDDLAVIDDPEDAEWPLKMLYWDGKGGREPAKRGIWGARSKDGVHWDRSLGLVLPDWGDRFNAVSSKVEGKYIVLGRAPGSRPAGRQVLRTDSADMRTWSAPTHLLAHDLEDPVNREYYSATAFPYESLLLGSIERMAVSPDKLDTELMWSHDCGFTWRRAPTRPAFLSPSAERRWDDTWVNLPTNGPIRHQNRLWFYYSGRSNAHNAPYPMNHGAIGLALLRIDGFASLHAAERHGWVLTPPMTWPAADLYVNADTRRDLTSHPGFNCGEVRVEARDESGRVIPGFGWDDNQPLLANTVNLPDSCARISWRNDKSARELAGQRIRLAFRLHDAHLFSFRARFDTPVAGR